MIPIHELKVGQSARVKVKTPPYLVLAQTAAGTTFLTDKMQVELIDTCFCIPTKANPFLMTNLDSGITHIMIGNTPVCGHRNTQNNVTGTRATCKKCLEKSVAKFSLDK